MRRNATKVAAAVLSLAVTMTSVNIPTSAAAATKKVKLNKTKATLKVGKSTTLKLKQGSKVLKATFTSNKPKIAKVGKKTGKVTAKKKGTATITATYKKKKYKCKITVKKATPAPTTKPTTAPTTEPTAAPSTEPTAAPTDAPSTEPTAAPADTVGAITTLEATSASTLKATFESAVSDDVKIVVKKGTTEIAGTISKDETNKIVTFTGSGNFTAGTYTMTATLGESSVSKDVEVKDSYVASIELTCKEALTDADGKTAFIYYDVKNQYGESVRSSENIEWNTSPAKTSVDKASGKITIKKEDKFVYGSSIYVTGVHVKTGTTLSTSITVGMPQAADSVVFAGFLNKKDTTKAPVESLPADFAKDTYVLLYKTLDQNGNALDIEGFTGDGNITFICDNPQLIASPLEYDSTYTVNGEEYASIKIQPGMWVDRGGEVNITWVANKTGKRDSKNFVIGANGVLKSLVLSAPVTTVADGDQWVNIPYTATDTTGANVTNYSTIVRSTNTLTLSSTVGELIVKEEKDGTAGIYWNDELSRTDFDDKSASDNQDRPVSLTTIVVGGESSNMLFNVSDMRRPTTIEKVDINDTWVNGDSVSPGLNEWGAFHFIDQYGKAMVDADTSHNTAVEAFFRQADTAAGFAGEAYGIKVDVSGTESATLGVKDGVYKYAGDDGKWGAIPSVDSKSNLTFNFNSAKRASDSVKYSIAKIKVADKADNDISKWDDVSKVKTATYTVVPFEDVSSGMTINGLGTRLQVITPYMNEFNGTSIGTTNGAFTAHPESNLEVTEIKPYGDNNAASTNTFTVSSVVDGKIVNVPVDKYLEVDTEKSAFVIDGNSVKSVTAGAITWSDLYNVNDIIKSRKDARKDLVLKVKGDKERVKKTVTISDAMSGIAEIRFDKTPDMPNLTKLSGYTVNIFDQYTANINNVEGVNCELAVSNIKENGNNLAYLSNSFKVRGNNGSPADFEIDGAEIGDTFTLTATAAGTNVSVSKDITVNADAAAFISSSKDKKPSDDTDLRKLLGYDR